MGWDFVGRAGELAALEAAWSQAADGEVAPLAVVYGEPGIGKTRLVSELARLVRGRGGEVLWGACYEGGDAHPYAVWAQAVRGWVERSGRERVGAALGDDARWLAPVLPDVVAGDPGGLSVPADVARLRLAEAMAGVLDSCERPAVVVLDDMQWAYPESLELFSHVARLATDALVVVCCRPTGLELGHPLAQRIAEAHRQRSCEYVSLGSLSLSEAGELLEQAAGGPLAAGLVDAVYEASGGNPFFLAELGRHLHGHGSVGRGRQLPESIRGAIGLRLAGLSAQTRHLLQLASVFTAGFRFAELRALSELEEGALLDCLEEALDEDLVRPLEGERYHFAHALVRQTLYERLSQSRRARLHRRLAETLERLHEHDPGKVAGELVRQYHASATLDGYERGTLHALTAGRSARLAGAPADAVVLLRLGLDLVRAGDIETRAQVLSELARAEGEAGRFEDAARTLEAALPLLENGRAPGEVIAELVYSAFRFAVVPQSLPAFEPLTARGLEALGQTRSLAWARLKLLHRFAEPQAFGPIVVLRSVRFDPEAVRVARTEGTEADYALTLEGSDPRLGAELEQLIPRIESWRDPAARLRALLNVVAHLTLVDAGGSPDADRLCAELEALADEVGVASHRAFARVFRAALLGGRGQFDAMEERLVAAAALFEQIPARSISAVLPLVRELTAQHVRADWAGLAPLMLDLARNPGSAGPLGLACAAFSAQACACGGEAERARAVLDSVLEALEFATAGDSGESPAVALAGAAVWELGAEDLAERLLPRARGFADVDGFEAYMTSTELTVARLYSVLGRFDQAVAYFERARVTLDRRRLPVLRAIVDYDEALARLAHEQPGAARLLASASARFKRLGMREWSRRAARLEAERELPDRLTSREAEILRLVAARRSNKQIAAELVISVHTVERHVQNAYRKIGARNRLEAGAYVARIGL